LKKGIVIKSTGSRYLVKSDDKIFLCTIKGKFRIQGIKTTNPVAVGDFVDFDTFENDELGIITAINDRRNYIIRRSVNLSKQTHIIAANVDEALLVATLVNPKTFQVFIDRFLVSCESYGVKASVVLNKTDLYDEELRKESDEMKTMYQKIGYVVFETSVLENKGIEELHNYLKNKTVVISGNSGVGKSSIINALNPKVMLKTSDISEFHGMGVHTTTFAEMIEFDDFRLIDTPGIKSFSLHDIKKEDVTGWFPEMFRLQKECKYYNCTHTKEPGCAVIRELENGTLPASRYKSYLSILNEDDEKYRIDKFKE
jgi:ribosome biogenesis GTPase